MANTKYEAKLRQEITDEANNKRKRMQEEIEEQERRQRLRKNVKI